mgnify:FL=1|tara:strand:+ start:2819 stop:3646 length:828 start_codon:yes stop_codon:yes gene_type:complete
MMDIITDSPFREMYYLVPIGWGGLPGDPITRPQPSDFIRKYFANKLDGFFVDIGANDGVTWNTTLGLETNNGWRGICIEPHPDIFKELTKDRYIYISSPLVLDDPDDINDSSIFKDLTGRMVHYPGRQAECIQIAIADKDGSADFLSFKGSWDSHMLSGLVDTIDPKQRKRDDFKKHSKTAKVKKVKCKKLQTILDERDITEINYLSIDVEGGELNVLNSIDFNKVRIDLISVEVNFDQDPINDILEKNGFQFIEKVASDCFYENRAVSRPFRRS